MNNMNTSPAKLAVVNIATQASMVSTERQRSLFNRGAYWAVMDLSTTTVQSLHFKREAAEANIPTIR